MNSSYSLIEMVQRGLFDYFYDHNRVVLEAAFQAPRPQSVSSRSESDSGDQSDSASLGEAVAKTVPEIIEGVTMKRRGSTRAARIHKARKGRRQSLKASEEIMSEGLGF